ncbi:MAG TPA: hypothetical protein VF307_06400 [Candidatus Nanopelagicaceae bacterium]
MGRPERGRSDVGLSERGRSVELLCGREVGLLAEGRPVADLPLDGRPEDGRAPLEGGRCESMSLLHSEWETLNNYK